jgi:O-antigen/teichoic acid export membrane protein
MKTKLDSVIKQLKNPIVFSSIIVFIGSMISNFFAYLYHLVLGRILGPVGYGELAALISVLYILGIPTITVQTMLIKYFAIYKAKGEIGKSHTLFMKTTKNLTYFLIIISVLIVLTSPLITNFLHLSSPIIIIWLCLFFIFSTLTIVNVSVLQGYQMFIWVAIFTVIPVALKLFISIPFAYLGVQWAMFASGIAAFISYILYFLPIKFIFKIPATSIDLTKKHIIKFSIPTLLTVLGTTSMYSADIILAKHFLPSVEAGIYSAVAILGKIIFFASSAITLVVYPMISEKVVKKINTENLVKMALGLVGLISFGITILYFLYPSMIVKNLFGKSFFDSIPFMGSFGIFISFYSIAQCLAMINLAQNKTYCGLVAMISSIVQIVIILFLHSSIQTIIYVNLLISIMFLLGEIIIYIFYNNLNKNETN